MPVPQQLIQQLKSLYPKPSIDPNWLNACYDWILQESGLHANQTAEIFEQINAQLLQSDLDDSMVKGTGLPPNVHELHDTRLASGPRDRILVQVNAITEIGHSAFQLQNVRQIRLDKADMAGLIEAGIEDEEEDAPIPPYPRSTLQLALSDGATVIRGIEYRKIPGLQLSVTPLGCKILLRNVLIRRGIAFLEPQSVTIFAGSQTEEREAVQDDEFARGLRERLGQASPEPDDRPPAIAPAPAPAPTPPPARRSPPPKREEATQRDAPIRNQPNRMPGPRSSSPKQEDPDTSYDWIPDDEMDDDFFAQLDDIERMASQPKRKPEPLFISPSPSPPPTTIKRPSAIPKQQISSRGSTAAFQGSQPPKKQSRDEDIIEFSSDEDIKVQPSNPSRSQQRNTKQSRNPMQTQRKIKEEEVIEISD